MPSHETQAGCSGRRSPSPPSLSRTSAAAPAQKGHPSQAREPHPAQARGITAVAPTSHEQPRTPAGRITTAWAARLMENTNVTPHGYRTSDGPAEIPPPHGAPTPHRRSSDRSAGCPERLPGNGHVMTERQRRPTARTRRIRLRSRDLLCRQHRANAEKVFCAVDPLAGICACHPGAWHTFPAAASWHWRSSAQRRCLAGSASLTVTRGSPGARSSGCQRLVIPDGVASGIRCKSAGEVPASW